MTSFHHRINRIIRTIIHTGRRTVAIALAGLALAGPATHAQAAYQEGYLAPMQGWRIMQPDYPSSHALDAISFEWDYFIIHSDTFNGIVGYVLANPRHKAAPLDWALLPLGNNVGIVGEVPGQRPVANYVNMGLDNSNVNGVLGWYHPDWKWDGEANSCVPTNTKIRAKNAMYTVDLDVAIGNRQRPMLSNMTVGTSIFFIQEHFPTVTGTIRRANGSVVKTFTARAGGEFARTRDVALWHSSLWCNLWGDNNHKAPMP